MTDHSNCSVDIDHTDELYPDWDTQHHAFHNTRAKCDLAGLSLEDKNKICACIYQESEFRINAVGKPNSNGTIDYSLCQFNTGTIRGVPLWIGKGAAFSSIQDVFNNPGKQVDIMIACFKAGHLYWWSSYQTSAYKKWLLPNSPMWKL